MRKQTFDRQFVTFFNLQFNYSHCFITTLIKFMSVINFSFIKISRNLSVIYNTILWSNLTFFANGLLLAVRVILQGLFLILGRQILLLGTIPWSGRGIILAVFAAVISASKILPSFAEDRPFWVLMFFVF